MIPLSFQTADPLSSQTEWPELYVAHVGPVRSWKRQEEYKWCRIRRAFSRRVVQKQVHLQQPITQLQPWYRPASIHPPALVRSQSSWFIAGAHYERWVTSLSNFGVTPFFGGNFILESISRWRLLRRITPSLNHSNFESCTSDASHSQAPVVWGGGQPGSGFCCALWSRVESACTGP